MKKLFHNIARHFKTKVIGDNNVTITGNTSTYINNSYVFTSNQQISDGKNKEHYRIGIGRFLIFIIPLIFVMGLTVYCVMINPSDAKSLADSWLDIAKGLAEFML